MITDFFRVDLPLTYYFKDNRDQEQADINDTINRIVFALNLRECKIQGINTVTSDSGKHYVYNKKRTLQLYNNKGSHQNFYFKPLASTTQKLIQKLDQPYYHLEKKSLQKIAKSSQKKFSYKSYLEKVFGTLF